jgi:hypothetical protein
MAAEFVVAGRRELPPGTVHWEFVLQSSEGGVWVYESGVAYDAAGQASVKAQAAAVVGWEPRSVVLVRKAWDLAQVVAEELATVVDGAVFCDVDNEVFFDARGTIVPVDSRDELEKRLANAFNNPQPFFDRWQREERERFAAKVAADSETKAANDWSDLD